MQAFAGAMAIGKELAPNFGQLLQVLEGPMPIRTISGLGMCCLYGHDRILSWIGAHYWVSA